MVDLLPDFLFGEEFSLADKILYVPGNASAPTLEETLKGLVILASGMIYHHSALNRSCGWTQRLTLLSHQKLQVIITLILTDQE